MFSWRDKKNIKKYQNFWIENSALTRAMGLVKDEYLMIIRG